ncbi:MAG: hypothetical protein K0S99_3556 [Thermomicrobiales bacterium]|nr:hypothetical protein [Thermomicrobiales bacterium]
MSLAEYRKVALTQPPLRVANFRGPDMPSHLFVLLTHPICPTRLDRRRDAIHAASHSLWRSAARIDRREIRVHLRGRVACRTKHGADAVGIDRGHVMIALVPRSTSRRRHHRGPARSSRDVRGSRRSRRRVDDETVCGGETCCRRGNRPILRRPQAFPDSRLRHARLESATAIRRSSTTGSRSSGFPTSAERRR